MRAEEPAGSSDGFALVMVLAFMLIVSAVIVPFAISARTRLMIAKNTIEQQRLSLLADGLITVLSGRLSRLPAELPTDGDLVYCQAGGSTFAARIQDHRGLIDLNASDAAQLAVGFEALGIDASQAAALADLTVASRSPPNAFGMSNPKPSRTSGLKSAPFESVSELAFMTASNGLPLDETYRLFTVHSKIGVVEPTLAPAPLPEKLGIAAETQTKPANGDVYSLQVTIQTASSGIVGSAGSIVTRANGGLFERVSQLPPLSISALRASEALPCPTLFGEKPARLIAEWANG